MSAGYAFAPTATVPRVDTRPGLGVADLDVAGLAVHLDNLVLLCLDDTVIGRAC